MIRTQHNTSERLSRQFTLLSVPHCVVLMIMSFGLTVLRLICDFVTGWSWSTAERWINERSTTSAVVSWWCYEGWESAERYRRPDSDLERDDSRKARTKGSSFGCKQVKRVTCEVFA